MNAKLWQLGQSDLVKGLIIAVLAPVVATLGEAMNVPGFDFVTYEWKTLLSIGLTAGLTYLMKNFASDTMKAGSLGRSANATPRGRTTTPPRAVSRAL